MLDRDLKNLHGPTGVRKLRLDRLRVGIIFRGKPAQRGLRLGPSSIRRQRPNTTALCR